MNPARPAFAMKNGAPRGAVLLDARSPQPGRFCTMSLANHSSIMRFS